MKFVILLLAFFIPLITSQQNTPTQFKCYKCVNYKAYGFARSQGEPAGERSGIPDCRKTNGIEVDCPSQYCFTSVKSDNKQFIVVRGCEDGNVTGLEPGCRPAPPLEACLCNSHLCNGENRTEVTTPIFDGHTKIVGISLTNLLGGVLVLLLMK